jgi:hypothetical protein
MRGVYLEFHAGLVCEGQMIKWQCNVGQKIKNKVKEGKKSKSKVKKGKK